MSSRFPRILLVVLTVLLYSIIIENGAVAFAQIGGFGVEPEEIPCCDHGIQAIIWSGINPKMTIRELASYCGPIMWFSPDEPLLNEAEGKDVMLPEPFPFEGSSSTPVVYYRLRTILVTEDAEANALIYDSTDQNNSIVDLRQIDGFDLDYFFYHLSVNAHLFKPFGGVSQQGS